MRFKYHFTTAYKGLKTNKSRSALTVLGIVIGIASIILVVSIGRGAENLILNEVSSLGAETIVVRPGKQPSGPSDFTETLFSESLIQRDLDALLKKANAPHIVEIMPAVAIPGSVSYEGETYRPSILGGDGDFFARTFNIFPEYGDVFSEDDIRNRASVAIIGSKVKEELFGGSDAVGNFIKIKDRKFRVVGVFPKRGQVAFFNMDSLVLIPYSTAQTYLLGISHFQELIVKADSPDNVARTVYDIEVTLREAHDITDPENDDFYVETQQGLVDQIKVIIGALTAMLSAIVAVALVVAGVGLMNIVLVSVTERTKEIGLRKALGATERDILLQFLIEAVMLTFIGGVIGVLIGALFGFLISLAITTFAGLSWTFTFPVSAALLGVGVSVVVGLVFGVYPARIAAKKSPIEALRYE